MNNDTMLTQDVSPLARRYEHILNEDLGLLCQFDSDGDVHFQLFEVGHFFIELQATDPCYFCLSFPRFVTSANTGLNKEQLLEIVNRVNASYKAIKLTAHFVESQGWCVSANIEVFLAASDYEPSTELLKATLRRNLSAIRAGVVAVHQEIAGLQGGPAGNA